MNVYFYNKIYKIIIHACKYINKGSSREIPSSKKDFYLKSQKN